MNFFSNKYKFHKLSSDTSIDESDSFLQDKASRKLHNVPEHRTWMSCFTWPLVVHTIILCIWIAIAVFMIRATTFSMKENLLLTYSPAQSALHMQRQIFNVNGESPYKGKPRPELELAWHDLLKYTNLRLTTEEMNKIDPERKSNSVHLPDGGYFATLQVMHELHCIKNIHRAIWSEHYAPNLTSEEESLRRIHLEHCLDTLRQGIMCRADLTPVTMRWGHEAIPHANFSSPHTCVDWEAIDDWAKERSIDQIFDPGYLKHPVLGDVYTEATLEQNERVGTVHDGFNL